MSAPLLDRLHRAPILADGAMGTLLFQRGVSFDRCFDELNLSEPAVVEEIHRACRFDPWFLREIEKIVRAEEEIRAKGLPREAGALRRVKAMGFSDKRLAYLALQSAHLRPGTGAAAAPTAGRSAIAGSGRSSASASSSLVIAPASNCCSSG